MAKYEDILKEIEGKTYTPVENRTTKKKKKYVEQAPVTTNTTNTQSSARSIIGNLTGISKIKDRLSDGLQAKDIADTLLGIRNRFDPVAGMGTKIGQDIATGNASNYIKGNKATQEIKDIWSDGYQAFDIRKTKNAITKTILGSAGDVAANWAKGELQTAEGLVDTSRYLLSDAIDLAGGDKTASEIRQRAKQNTTGLIFGENDQYNNPKENGWAKKLDDYSVFGNTMDQIFQSVGQQSFRIGLANATGIDQASTAGQILNNTEIFAGSYGSAKSQALMEGADYGTASLRGTISGFAELISENMFDAIPGFKTAGFAEKSGVKNLLAEAAEKTFGKGAGKYIIRGLNSIGEGVEEGASNFLETTFTDIANAVVPEIASLFGKEYEYNYGMQEGQGLDKNKSLGDNIKKLFSDAFGSTFTKETGQSFLVAAISTLITGAATDTMTNVQRNKVINEYAKENNISKEKATKLFDGIRDLRLKQRVESTTGYEQRMEMQDQATKQLAQELREGAKSGQKIDLQELFDRTPKTRKESKFVFTDDEVKNFDRRLATEIATSNINNEQDVHDMVRKINTAQKINKTVQYHPVTTEGLYQLGFIDKDTNGNYTLNGKKYIPRGLTQFGNEIYVNLDVGTKSATQAMFHEMFESFKATSPDQYNKFKQMVVDIVGQETIDNEKAQYKEMYQKKGAKLTDNIEDEIINDKFGELAENQNFINKIADNRNVLEKFIDSIKNMIKYVKGTPEEKEFIKLQNKLEKEFAKRYKETDFSKANNKSKDTAFSLTEQLENQATKLTEQNIENKKAIRQNIEDYIKTNNIEYPTISEMLDSMDDYNMMDNSNYDLEDLKQAQKLYREVAKEIYDENVRNNPKNNATFEGKPFWSGSVSLIDGVIEEVHSYEEANAADFNHSMYFSESQIDKMDSGENAFFWIQNGNIEGVWRNETPSSIIQKIKEQIKFKTNSNTKYSLTSTKNSQGNNLTPQQQEYFKDSKIVDKDGNLQVMYHGSSTGSYNTFDFSKIGNNSHNDGWFGKGFYFTEDKAVADNYDWSKDKSGKTYEVYLNITNPFYWNNIKTEEQLNQLNEELDLEHPLVWNRYSQEIHWLTSEEYGNAAELTEALKKAGYDGIIFKYSHGNGDSETVAFYPNQIKNTHNMRPTSNEDIRYSLADNNVVYRAGTQTGQMESGTFFSPNKTDADNYGNSAEYHIDKSANLYNGISSKEYAEQNNLMNVKNDVLKDKLGVDTLQEVEDIHYNWTTPSYLDKNPNLYHFAYQYMAKNDLESKGYDGAIWTHEDDLTPQQYQIWNNDKVNNDTRYSLAPTKDNTGKELTKEQQNFFKDSKVVDDDGNLLRLYHGGEQNYNVFRSEFNEYYFTPDENAAQDYGSLVRPFYLNFTNPYEVDFEGKNDKANDLYENGVFDVIDYAKENGYDGAIIRNTYDGANTHDQYVAFAPNQIKNVDNLNPTDNPDIRYSLTTNKDSTGRELSPKQQEYFRDTKVVDENGNLLLMHNGRYSNDTVFKPSRWTNEKNGPTQIKGYFASDSEYSEIYGDVSDYYLNIKNPLYMGVDGQEAFTLDEWQQFFKEHGITGVEFDSSLYGPNTKGNFPTKNGKPRYLAFEIVDSDEYWNGDGNVTERIKAAGYDGLTWTEGGIAYMPFESNQIKNVDNLNPTENDDIRFSLTPLNELDPKKEYYFRGQTNNEQKIAYNNTHFQGDTEGGVFVTPNRDIAEKYGKNVLAMEKNESNTVSVEESDRLQEWASKQVNDDINNQRESDYVIEQMALGRPRAFAEYTGKPFVETGDMFGEPGEAIYYQEVADGTSTYRDNYSLTSNQNIDSKEVAPIGTTTDEIIAPIREDISNLSNQLNNLSNQIKTLQNGAETISDNDIAPVNPYRERAIAQREANQRAEEMYKDENYWKSIEESAEQVSDLDEKSAKKMSRNIGKELGLKQKQIKDLQNVIQKAFDEGYSLQDIKNELDMQFGHQTVSERLDEVIDTQRELRNIKIKVSPEIQRDIPDYGYWKQQYFGKIRFSNQGSPVDVVYAELSDRNPSMYPSDIINPTEQLLRIAEVADMDRKYTIDYEMDKNTIDEAANYIHDTIQETLYANAMRQQTDLEKNAMQYNERTQDIPIKKRTRQEVRENLQNTMGITVEDLQVGNDIGSMSYNLTTPERVNEKVFGREVGRKINEQTVFFAKHQEAERIRFLNRELKEIADLGIKARSKESALVQQYGEGLLDDVQLAQEVSDKATQEKIKNAARVLRSKYDTYLDQINEELVDMGYDPIPKRKDYMRHFQELTDKFSQAGIPFNRQALNSENLPTDINGLTEFNVPGKNWFASAQRRTGEKTTYDAITGIDGYLQGASNLMYHTETIQRYRALEKLIRDTYGQQHGLDVFGDDLTSEQAMQRITDIQEGKLSNYAAWLKEQGNALAGKKGALDRGFERALGRRAYTLASELKKQVGSNMTGFNVRSALTNFISSTIAASKTNKLAMVKGTVDTIRNMFNDDGFIDRSDFLTSRLRNDTSISKKTWQKISNAGQILMSGSDWFTSNLITRSKYYEGIQKGMTDAQAMNYANDFAARVMGDRSKGATAEAFNSKTLGFLTQFQLETNNQWQYMIHDTKMEFQENLAKEGGLKAGATVLFQMGQLAAYSYLFNEMFEQLTGSRAAFDILDIIKKLFGLDDDDKDKTFEERMKEAGSELVDALPFASLFGSGGRLPIGEMLTPAQTLYDYITGGTNKYGQDITLKDVSKDTLEALPYYVLPTGYGQIKKTVKGLGMYANEVPGSYTDSGNLRFTADTDTGSVIKNALFGQWSGEEAKKYRESGYKTIRANDIQEMQDLNMNSSEYREYKNDLKEAGSKNADKLDYINSLNIPISQKNIMASNVVDKPVDMSDYTTYEEFDFAYKNPGKYQAMKAIANNYKDYQTYMSGIEEVRDKYSQTKGYSTEQRKAKVVSYVNSLDLTIPQKAMLLRQYYSSYKRYNNEIVNYVASLDIEYQEKVEILQSLKFKVDDEGNVSW